MVCGQTGVIVAEMMSPVDRTSLDLLASKELHDYFSLDPAEARASDLQPLKLWQLNRGQFPRLSQLARDIFSIAGMFILIFLRQIIRNLIGSAVSVERVFSGARDTLSLRRVSLHPETIRSLMLLKHKLHLRRH
jgi:hypothetical protein